MKTNLLALRIYACVFLFSLSLSQLFAQECGVIYVTPNGASSGTAGTKANPANLAYGLTLVSPTDNRVWLAFGNYNISNHINLVSNVTIEGGFDPATWAKSSSTASVINRDNSNVMPAPANAIIAFMGQNISNFRLHDLTINVASATTASTTVYGVLLNGCSNYNIVRCLVNTGNGGNGVNGTPGTPGANGNPGQNGAPGNPNETGWNVPTPGGTGGYNGGNGAGNGRHSNGTPPGVAGGGPCGGNGGATGTGPQCSAGCFFGSPNCNSATPGQPGGNGGAGTAGTNGAAGPAGAGGAPGFYIAGGPAGNGTNGTAGCGGGGGGGGGGRQNDGPDDVGGAGGGGGGGGYGGTGGTGGTGGGGSICFFLFNNGAGGSIIDCGSNPGTGGIGGIGGAGGAGGAGGTGGNGGAPGCGNTPGGRGGNGGAGGAGGNGGNGSNGLSANLNAAGASSVPTFIPSTTVPGNPPSITVDSRGCTNSSLTFTAPTTGNWNFGAGANPPTASGAGPHQVQYSSTGRKTITFNGTAFTEFVDIFNTAPGGGFISPGDTTIPIGCFHTFTSTLPGNFYTWIFNGANVDTVAGTTAQTVDSVYFLSPGFYQVYLEVSTATTCCGAIRDTITVTATANAINVTLAASTNTICQGEPITFTASPTGYLQYDFYQNTTVAQASNQNVFTTSTLQPGDSVTVRAFDGICYSNPSATIYPTVNVAPVVTLSSSDADNTICAGESVTFTATPAGLNLYTFLDGATILQSGTSNTYTTTTLATGNSITVQVTHNGCPDTSSAIVTVVNPVPVVTLASSDADNIICTGDAITFTASPTGLTQYDFFENGSPAQSSASNTYVTTALVTGTSVTVSATHLGCTSAVSTGITVTVNTYPVVTLASSDADNTICAGESATFTASPAGLTSYTFLDGATILQQGVQNTYTTTALVSGNSITVIGFNANCSDTSAAIATVVNAIPSITLSSSDADNNICAGDVITFTALPTGYAQYDFFENGNNVQSSATNTYTTATLTTGTQVTATATNNGCTSTATAAITVTVNPYPVVSLSSSDADNIVCEGQPVTFTASPSTLQVYGFYDATTQVQTGTGNTYTVNGMLSGHSISVIASQNGCADTSNTIGLQVVPAPVANAGTDQQACADAPPVTLTSIPTGGVWSGTGVDANGAFNPGTGAGTYNLVYTVTDALTGCADADTTVFTVHALPIADAGSDTTICETESTQLTATGGTSYTWLPATGLNNANIDAPLATPAATTTYTVTVTNANSCIAVDSVTITVAPKPVAAFTADAACAQSQVQFINTSTGTSFSWDYGDGGSSTQSDPLHAFASDGNYTVTLIATEGQCSDTASNVVEIYPLPVAAFTVDPTVGEANVDTISFMADTFGVATWYWDLGNGEYSTQPEMFMVYADTGYYTIALMVTNSYGCRDSLQLVDHLYIVDPSKLFVPNAFSPNGDNLNDEFFVLGSGFKSMLFQIYDRWGELVFETTDQSRGWDGSKNGTPLVPGVYVYKLTVNFNNYTQERLKGSIMLLR